MATSPETVLLTLSSVVALGFLGRLFFRATRVSDILLLIGFGILLGNVIRPFDASAFVALAPIVGTFALLIILFEGGLDLRLFDLAHGLARGASLALLGFVFSVALVAVTTRYVLDLEWLRALLLGTILGGSSSIAVMPIVRRLPVHDRTRVILSLESALTDVFCVVGALTISSVLALRASPTVADIGGQVLGGFAVAAVIGVLAGFLWLKFLDSRIGEGVYYMLTVAAVLFLHVAITYVEANGPVAVLAFGVTLGNHQSFRRFLRIRSGGFTSALRAFQSETAFVTRAFFFVYLGLVLPLSAFTPRNISVGLMLLGALGLARLGAVVGGSLGSTALAGDRTVWWAMMPRGLAAAVLASVPALTYGISGTEDFVAFAALVIILTNVVGSLAGLLARPPPKAETARTQARSRRFSFDTEA